MRAAEPMTEFPDLRVDQVGRRSAARAVNAFAPATLATSPREASPWMRRGSCRRAVLLLAVADQQAATAVTSTTSTDTVEVQYNQAGPSGRGEHRGHLHLTATPWRTHPSTPAGRSASTDTKQRHCSIVTCSTHPSLSVPEREPGMSGCPPVRRSRLSCPVTRSLRSTWGLVSWPWLNTEEILPSPGDSRSQRRWFGRERHRRTADQSRHPH
jgi:hypothetical protein